MLYALIENDTVRMITSDEAKERNYANTQSRHNWKSLDEVAWLAGRASTEDTLYIGVDKGGNISPRFDIIKAPKVGDDVSMSFNGDTYPCEKIASISKSMKVITTTDGKKFYHRKQTGVWLYVGTFALVQGHRYEQNPHF